MESRIVLERDADEAELAAVKKLAAPYDFEVSASYETKAIDPVTAAIILIFWTRTTGPR